MREEYGSREMHRAEMADSPFLQFEQWFAEASFYKMDKDQVIVKDSDSFIVNDG